MQQIAFKNVAVFVLTRKTKVEPKKKTNKKTHTHRM